jgi:tRNA threonylcarbamoyladenosine biosynthesis protein TsaE
MIYQSKSPEDTISLGEKFAKNISIGDIIGLNGELGSGKTQFVKGIGSYFGVSDIINSPTFIIVNEYSGTNPESEKALKINHFDLYRISSPRELSVIGFEDYLNMNSITIIEWSKLAEIYLGTEIKNVKFDYGEAENERIIEF